MGIAMLLSGVRVTMLTTSDVKGEANEVPLIIWFAIVMDKERDRGRYQARVISLLIEKQFNQARKISNSG